MTYQFDTDIAALYGVDESIMITNLQFWIRKNEANGKHFHDGRFWTYNSIDAFTKLFPFWTARQIRRILKSLEDKGVIVTGNYNTSAYDRTTWYAFGDSFLHKCQKHFTETSNGKDESGKSVINNVTDIKPDNKPNEAADGGLFPHEQSFEPVPEMVLNPGTLTITRPRRTAEPAACLFENSRYADFQKFDAEFTAPEFADVDIVYYFHAVADWSAQKGKKMKDWIATARNFIRGDMEKGKLHRIGGGSGLSPDAIKYLQDMAD